MELLGGLPLPLALVVLALVDGLSVGTLLIPVFLLLSPGRVRAGRILLYLGTIAVFYLVVGLLFLWGLVNLVDVAADFLSSPAGTITRLVVGAALIVIAFALPTGASTRKAATSMSSVSSSAASASGSASASYAQPSSSHDPLLPPAAPASYAPPAASLSPTAPSPGTASAASPGRITRWRERLLDPRTRGAAVMAVAIAAGLVEVATMLPYLLAMTMLADAGVSTPFRVAALVVYCALMIAPAVVLLVLRLVAAPLVQRPLERFAAWMERTGAENTAWIIGIIGFLIARSAASELGIFQAIHGLLNR